MHSESFELLSRHWVIEHIGVVQTLSPLNKDFEMVFAETGFIIGQFFAESNFICHNETGFRLF